MKRAEEFLREFNGEGIQHIALICDDLVACWDKLKDQGVPFMTAPPDTYYKMLSGPSHRSVQFSLNLSSASGTIKMALARGTLRRYLSL